MRKNCITEFSIRLNTLFLKLKLSDAYKLIKILLKLRLKEISRI
jgi:hypothetical protein